MDAVSSRIFLCVFDASSGLMSPRTKNGILYCECHVEVYFRDPRWSNYFSVGGNQSVVSRWLVCSLFSVVLVFT